MSALTKLYPLAFSTTVKYQSLSHLAHVCHNLHGHIYHNSYHKKVKNFRNAVPIFWVFSCDILGRNFYLILPYYCLYLAHFYDFHWYANRSSSLFYLPPLQPLLLYLRCKSWQQVWVQGCIVFLYPLGLSRLSLTTRIERFVHPFWHPLPCLPLLHFCASHGYKGSPIWRPPGPLSSSTTSFIIVAWIMVIRNKAKGCSGLLPPFHLRLLRPHLYAQKEKVFWKYVNSDF